MPDEDNWIPVSERLPEVKCFDNFIVTDSCGDVYVAEYDSNGKWVYNEDLYTAHRVDDVVAWQPLPEPYKGE